MFAHKDSNTVANKGSKKFIAVMPDDVVRLWRIPWLRDAVGGLASIAVRGA